MTLAAPAPGEVHVRRVALDLETSGMELLSEDERMRAGRFRFSEDARRWSAGRSLLRRILGAYLDADPKALRFEIGPWGKPGLRDCPLRFSVSHSGAAALLAFTWQREVGVDIERSRCDFSPDELAAQVFSARELGWLRGVPAAERHRAFLTLWTAKEAYVKVYGKGLSFPLAELTLISVSGTDRFDVLDLTYDGSRPEVSVCRLPSETDYAAALALEGPLTCLHDFDHSHVPFDCHVPFD